jgi:hypothetical protein
MVGAELLDLSLDFAGGPRIDHFPALAASGEILRPPIGRDRALLR